MLVTLQKIIAMAQGGNYCVPAINVYNTETVMGVIAAAEETRSPVILQVYPRLIAEEAGFYVCPTALAAAHRASVPVCLHLDHGPSEFEVSRALRWGMTGIMLDGSPKPFAENVALTRRVVELCKPLGIGVEGELGHIGSVNDDVMDEFTSPAAAAEFVKETGVCCLAVLIGNAHGHYKKPPKLDIDRVAAIRKATGGVPLVLHGGTGIPDDQVRAAIAAGVRKMNISTEICCTFADAVKASLDDPKHSIAIDVFMKGAIAAVKEKAIAKMVLTGAAGRAV